MKKIIILVVFLFFATLPGIASDMSAKDYYNCGLIRFGSKDYLGAILDCTKAIQLDANYAEAYSTRGASKYNSKDYTGAIDDLTKAMQLDPNNSTAYYFRGLCKCELKDLKGSIDDLTKAIEIKPDYAQAFFVRGIVKSVSGNNKAAMVDLEQSKNLSLSQNNMKAYQITVKIINGLRYKKSVSGTISKSTAIQDVDFEPYMRELQKRIKQNWNPPQEDKSSKVVMLFNVDKIGNLGQIKILKSSGIQSVDDAARLAVSKTAPFMQLPSEFKGQSIYIQFTFDYNVLSEAQALN